MSRSPSWLRAAQHAHLKQKSRRDVALTGAQSFMADPRL
jgi:hypothetical protein